jgi:sialic acid synthase SpsE
MKIASFHICDLEMISYVSTRAQRVFLSTGMATYEEIDEAVSILKDVPELYLLHCVSEYPLSYENVNLRVIAALKNRYGDVARIGFSDHTIGILAPVAAAAFGAEVIEKHITLDKNLEGTDHILSADPCELIEMLRQIRAVEKILGSGRKVLTDVEKSHKEFLRHRFSHKEAYSREASYDFGINTRARRV